MKKLNLWLLASLFVTAFTLTACGDNDDDTPPETNPLFGRWEAQHSFGADTNISNGYILTGTYQVSGQTINVTFTKFQRLTDDKDTFEQVDQYVYTYRLENNKLYISGDDTNGKEFNNTEFVKK